MGTEVTVKEEVHPEMRSQTIVSCLAQHPRVEFRHSITRWRLVSSCEGSVYQIRMHGRVQGVGYRAWMARHAKDIGVDGWVRNRRDGSVEAVVCGDEASVQALIEACWAGPRWAKVVAVDTGAAGLTNRRRASLSWRRSER